MLEAGGTLGPYEITAPLGKGGMGEVYRARDPQLDRDVAIKVLPTALVRDPERIARFEREAKLLASLNHPNIAGVFGFAQSDGSRFLVMEYVEGHTLSDRLDAGALPLDEALEIARQIAAALEEAHERGIVHRDLKPGNVMITPEGKVKVLDFGLAKAMAEDSSAVSDANSPTITAAFTRPGVVLGTAAYMSPEQARGRSVDKRTDIWSFGVVLYEMLTGLGPFTGETVSDSIAAILHKEPDWALLPASTPPSVRHVLRRCLARNKQERYRDIGDTALDLAAADSIAPAPSERIESRGARGWIAAAVLAVLLVVSLALSWRAPATQTQSVPTYVNLSTESGDGVQGAVEALLLAVSNDGRTVAYCAQHEGAIQLHIRQLGERQAKVLEGTTDAVDPFFSPDGRWVAYFTGDSLMKVSVRGGAPVRIAATSESRSGVWLEDDTIIFAPGFASPLMRVSASGGDVTPVTTLDTSNDERTHRWPDVSPNGKWISFTVGLTNSPADYDAARIDAVSLETGERRTLVQGGNMARWAASGHLVFYRRRVLFAVPVDLSTATVLNAPTPIVDAVAGESTSGASHFAIARNGTLVYVSDPEPPTDHELVWVDREGRIELIDAPRRQYYQPQISPDGKEILVGIGPGFGIGAIWKYNLAQKALLRQTFGSNTWDGSWMPDGRSIVVVEGGVPTKMYVQTPNSTSPPRSLYEIDYPIVISSVTPDGQGVIFWEHGRTDTDLQMVGTDGSAEAETLVADHGEQYGGVLSPDGKWLAYVSSEGGGLRTGEVFVQPLHRAESKRQVSVNGGNAPFWSHKGDELFYIHNEEFIALPVHADGEQLTFGTPHRLFDVPPQPPAEPTLTPYDVAPDDSRFLFVRTTRPYNANRRLNLVLDWFTELEKLAPAE